MGEKRGFFKRIRERVRPRKPKPEADENKAEMTETAISEAARTQVTGTLSVAEPGLEAEKIEETEYHKTESAVKKDDKNEERQPPSVDPKEVPASKVETIDELFLGLSTRLAIIKA